VKQFLGSKLVAGLGFAKSEGVKPDPRTRKSQRRVDRFRLSPSGYRPFPVVSLTSPE